MHVKREPIAELNLKELVRKLAIGRGPALSLIAAAPGFGKSSMLASLIGARSVKKECQAIWINGGVIASEAHFSATLARSLRRVDETQTSVVQLLHAASTPQRVVLAIDDLDTLVFKRESLLAAIRDALVRIPSLRLAATCLASNRLRLLRAFNGSEAVEALGVAWMTIEPMPDDQARKLIERRSPGLSTDLASQVIAAVGGHPAALVFLAKLASLMPDVARLPVEFLMHSADFAGAVYAEAWSSLGPQQRAVLWEMSMHSPISAGAIANATHLPASHISAQISRLIADGLVQRTDQRGQFSVAPLLALWIAGRATRSATIAPGSHDPHGSVNSARSLLLQSRSAAVLGGAL